MGKASGLESVRRWRRSLERAAEMALKKAAMDVNQAKRELEGIATARRLLGVGLGERLREGASSEVFRLYSTASPDGLERNVLERLTLTEAERAQAEVHYAECRRDRKVMENMLERRGAEARMEASRREQVRVDEATMRRLKKQAAESSIGRSE